MPILIFALDIQECVITLGALCSFWSSTNLKLLHYGMCKYKIRHDNSPGVVAEHMIYAVLLALSISQARQEMGRKCRWSM